MKTPYWFSYMKWKDRFECFFLTSPLLASSCFLWPFMFLRGRSCFALGLRAYFSLTCTFCIFLLVEQFSLEKKENIIVRSCFPWQFLLQLNAWLYIYIYIKLFSIEYIEDLYTITVLFLFCGTVFPSDLHHDCLHQVWFLFGVLGELTLTCFLHFLTRFLPHI